MPYYIFIIFIIIPKALYNWVAGSLSTLTLWQPFALDHLGSGKRSSRLLNFSSSLDTHPAQLETWRKKSRTSWYGKYTMIHEVLCIPQGGPLSVRSGVIRFISPISIELFHPSYRCKKPFIAVKKNPTYNDRLRPQQHVVQDFWTINSCLLRSLLFQGSPKWLLRKNPCSENQSRSQKLDVERFFLGWFFV